MRTDQRLLCLLPILVVILAGCQNDQDPVGIGPPLQMAEGVVVEVHDESPVDGNVVVVLRQDDDTLLSAYLPSLFTSPPPASSTSRV
jgi:hypothetical protein